MWTEKESILAKRRVLGFTPATSLSLGSHFNETRKQRLTHTHTLSVAFSRKWGQNKQQRVEMRNGVCVGPWGPLEFKHWHGSIQGVVTKERPSRRQTEQKHCPSVWWPTFGNIQAGKNVYFHVAFKWQWHLGCRRTQAVTCVYLLANKKNESSQGKKPVLLLFFHLQHASKVNAANQFVGNLHWHLLYLLKKNYLCLFIHIPGEGDSIVGDFFNVADCIKALLVISCEETGSNFRLHSIHSNQWVWNTIICIKTHSKQD